MTKDHNRSYPSGHTVRGNIVAFVLSVVMPERAEEILARGRIFGESRIVCGVHWSTDVVAGYSYAAGLVPPF
ncbi:MAG: phosphatase PAP2 family protein [Acetobacteraceae bacterium]